MVSKSFRKITTSEGIVRIPEITVSDLTLGEKLLIWRKRKGFTQKEAAPYLSMSWNFYKEVENGKREIRLTEIPFIGELEANEICLILRKRSGWTINECAEDAGISRYWYNMMEKGKVSPNLLVRYWGEDERK